MVMSFGAATATWRPLSFPQARASLWGASACCMLPNRMPSRSAHERPLAQKRKLCSLPALPCLALLCSALTSQTCQDDVGPALWRISTSESDCYACDSEVRVPAMTAPTLPQGCRKVVARLPQNCRRIAAELPQNCRLFHHSGLPF
jgi:hypothetical protein